MTNESGGKVQGPKEKGRGAGGRSKPPPRTLTPLWIISLFVSLTETVIGVAATQTSGTIQAALVAFAIGFPVLVASGFFAILWVKPGALYHPAEYGATDVARYVEALHGPIQLVRSTSEVPDDIKAFGNPDHFRLLFKAQSRTWKKSTKAMEVPGGCLVQVTTELLGQDNCWRVSEALSFVPDVVIVPDASTGSGNHLGDSGQVASG